ncbi:hypothetical protein HKX48_004257 [Thoreauomyces humboldtii]|nr:hypothetical protein HKX48_004257 [Thoreauomyces humboldtii]
MCPRHCKDLDAGGTWYKNSPVGDDTMRKILKGAVAAAGINTDGRKISGVPQDVVMKLTGHKSDSGLAVYNQITTEQRLQVAIAMKPPRSDSEKENAVPSAMEQSIPAPLETDTALVPHPVGPAAPVVVPAPPVDPVGPVGPAGSASGSAGMFNIGGVNQTVHIHMYQNPPPQ